MIEPAASTAPRPASRRPRLAARHVPDLALNERLVRERDRDRARELARTLALGIGVLVPLLLYVWQQVAFMETAYRVEELRAARGQLERSLSVVQLERASLESLDRVETLARERLGMRQPPPEAVLVVRPSRPAEATPPAGAAEER